jgi:protein gp37
MEKSNIQWTDATWNIARGCTKVDEDCKFCYMYRDSFDSTRYDPLQVVRTKTVFNMPLKLKEPSKIFTCSLTDFFHEAIDSYRQEAWDIIRKCPQHTFQILTKRPERITGCLPNDWGKGWDNVWIGTSVGSQKSLQRICALHSVECKIKFLSLEPLHGEIDLMYPKEIFPDGAHMCCSGRDCGCMGQPTEPPLIYGISWVIVGGESGNNTGKYRYRPCELSWIENIISQCQSYKIPVFVKQMGTHLAKQMGLKDRHGGNIEEWPEHLRIRQFPTIN